MVRICQPRLSWSAPIPIIFTVGVDPVELGLVVSLARPGGNLTGFTLLAGELYPKRLRAAVRIRTVATGTRRP